MAASTGRALQTLRTRRARICAVATLSVGLALAPLHTAATSAAAPANTCFGRALAIGSRGQDVKRLQGALNFVGLRRGRADGNFGAGTRSAYRRLEQLMGWRVDGIATLSELSWGACESATPPPEPTAAPTDVAVAAPPVPSAAPAAPPVPVAPALADAVIVPAIQMERPIVIGYGSQATINACLGAVLYAGDWPGSNTGMYLAAHRTSCGNLGFNGIQDLSAGARVTIRHNGVTSNYAVQSVTVAIVGQPLVMPSVGVLVLQTSKGGNEVWVVTTTAV